MDGYDIRWMVSILSESTVEMMIEGNAMEHQPLSIQVPQSALVFAILVCDLH